MYKETLNFLTCTINSIVAVARIKELEYKPFDNIVVVDSLNGLMFPLDKIIDVKNVRFYCPTANKANHYLKYYICNILNFKVYKELNAVTTKPNTYQCVEPENLLLFDAEMINDDVFGKENE